MKYTPEEVEKMRRDAEQQAAIDVEGATAISETIRREAPQAFSKFITVSELCALTHAEKHQIYYAINESPDKLRAIKRVIWFVEIDTAIAYADTLKNRRLARLGRLIKAANRQIERNKALLAELNGTSPAKKPLDVPTEHKRTPPDVPNMVTITQAAIELGVTQPRASELFRPYADKKERHGLFVFVPRSLVEEVAHAVGSAPSGT